MSLVKTLKSQKVQKRVISFVCPTIGQIMGENFLSVIKAFDFYCISPEVRNGPLCCCVHIHGYILLAVGVVCTFFLFSCCFIVPFPFAHLHVRL